MWRSKAYILLVYRKKMLVDVTLNHFTSIIQDSHHLQWRFHSGTECYCPHTASDNSLVHLNWRENAECIYGNIILVMNELRRLFHYIYCTIAYTERLHTWILCDVLLGIADSRWTIIMPKGHGPCARRRQCCCLVTDRLYVFGGTR